MKFNQRILFICNDAGKLARQFNGEEMSLADALPLRDDISTDEITPLPVMMNYDSRLGRYAHTGLTIGTERPVLDDMLLNAPFEVLVGGRRYGKGSSREHSPLAEKSAGIKLIIAESFERIYRQNCDNLGLLTSTDMELAGRIQRGEDISLDDILAGRDEMACQIVRAGGLLKFGAAHLATAQPVQPASPLPMTLGQKIIQRHLLQVAGANTSLETGSGVFVKADYRFIHEYYTAMAAHMIAEAFGNDAVLHDPQTIILFEDHLSYAHRSATHVKLGLLPQVRELSAAHRNFGVRYNLTDHSYLGTEDGSEGISHAMMAEKYALPGMLVVGTDSHTPHSGALGCFAYGVGSTDMAAAFLTGASKLTMAETLCVRLDGQLPEDVMAKDVALAILATDFIRNGGGLGRIFEFNGTALAGMSVDERATLTNMVAEMGGLTGLCMPDDETVRFLKERRNIDFTIEPWMYSDPGADYAHTLEIDCAALRPMLARPGDPGRGVAVADLGQKISVDIAYGGSCTAGKQADFDAYHAVAQWAMQRGLKVPDEVQLYLQCGTIEVRDYCVRNNYLEAFSYVGAELLGPSCGACGQCGPGVSTDESQVTISAINRNFPGRGGPGQTWLGNPATVMASALAGYITSFGALKSLNENIQKS